MNYTKHSTPPLSKRRPSLSENISILTNNIENEVSNYLKSDLYKTPKSRRYFDDSPEIKHTVIEIEKESELSALSI